MNKILDYLFHKPTLLVAAIWSYVGHLFSDETYLKVRFRLLMGKWPDLKNPKTFNEKLQWLKLHDRRPEYTMMVDKVAVKDYVAGIIGRKYVIPTLGVWDRPEDIEWEKLPEQFVLKTTNGGGSRGVVICTDKASLNKKRAIEILKSSMSSNGFRIQGEWPYKNVPKRVLAEEYIKPTAETNDLRDYKFFCFNGGVKFFKVDFNRHTDHHANYYDREGALMPFGEKDYMAIKDAKIEIPSSLDRMMSLAEEIAKDKTFVRVDMYDNDDEINFGEITFYPAGGFGKFEPEEWDSILGVYLQLPVNQENTPPVGKKDRVAIFTSVITAQNVIDERRWRLCA